MAKYCIVCGCVIRGRARKYCEDCKRKEHLEQMHKYYVDNTSNWQYGGKYWNSQSFGKCGTGSLGEHANKNFDEEIKKVHKEMLNLGLRKPIN